MRCPTPRRRSWRRCARSRPWPCSTCASRAAEPTAARGIKRCSPGTRVLVLSARGDRETVLEMLEAGADGYLVKGSPRRDHPELDRAHRERAGQPLGRGDRRRDRGARRPAARSPAHRGSLAAARGARPPRAGRRRRARRLPADLHAGRLDRRRRGAGALPRPAGARSRALVRRGRRGRAPARARARGGARRAGLALPALPDHVFLSVNVSPATLATPAFLRADRRQRRRAGGRRDHRARAHPRLRGPARRARCRARARRARRDRRCGRGLREPAPHPAARAGVHQARPHADRRHRVGSLAPGAGGRPDLVRREASTRRSSPRASSAPPRSRSSPSSACATGRATSSRAPRRCRCRCSWARRPPMRTRAHERHRTARRSSPRAPSAASWRTTIRRSSTPSAASSRASAASSWSVARATATRRSS